MTSAWLALCAVLCAPQGVVQTPQEPARPILSGVVVDPQGGGIPGATVVVTALVGTAAITTKTDGLGRWSVLSLNPGAYQVVVSLQYFKTAAHKLVTVVNGQPISLRTTLSVAGEEWICLDCGWIPGPFDLDVATLQVPSGLWSLPLKDRSAIELVTLLPGFDSGPTASTLAPTAFGLPSSMTRVFIEGLDASPGRSTPIVPLEVDGIYSSEIAGRTLGGHVRNASPATLRFSAESGSNQPRGSTYGYLRPFGTVPSNRAGIVLSGPIVFPGAFNGHGRAFYFIAVDYARTDDGVEQARQTLVVGRADFNATSRHRLTFLAEAARKHLTLAGDGASTGGVGANLIERSTLTRNAVNEIRLAASSRSQSVDRDWRVADELSYLAGRHSISVGFTVHGPIVAFRSEPQVVVFLQDDWHLHSDVTLDVGVRNDRALIHAAWSPQAPSGWLRHLLGKGRTALQASYVQMHGSLDAKAMSADVQRRVGHDSAVIVRFTRVRTVTTDYKQAEWTFDKPGPRVLVRFSYAHQSARGLESVRQNTAKFYVSWPIGDGAWRTSKTSTWVGRAFRDWTLAAVGRVENHRSLDVAIHKRIFIGVRSHLDFALEAYDVFNTLGRSVTNVPQSVTDLISRGDVTHVFDRPGRTYQFVSRINW